MTDNADQDLTEFRDIIESNIRDFVAEMRAIDLVDLISFIRFESFPTVEDLVNSSTELFFKPEMLLFSWAAGVDVRWDALPAVTLGLEFRHPTVTVFFNLTIRDSEQSVEILGVIFDEPGPDAVRQLAKAFEDARLVVRGPPRLALVAPPRSARTRRGLPWA